MFGGEILIENQMPLFPDARKQVSSDNCFLFFVSFSKTINLINSVFLSNLQKRKKENEN